MTELFWLVFTFYIGFRVGKYIGVARTMMMVQDIIVDLQRIQNSFKQWNEDNL